MQAVEDRSVECDCDWGWCVHTGLRRCVAKKEKETNWTELWHIFKTHCYPHGYLLPSYSLILIFPVRIPQGGTRILPCHLPSCSAVVYTYVCTWLRVVQCNYAQHGQQDWPEPDNRFGDSYSSCPEAGRWAHLKELQGQEWNQAMD